MPRFNHSKSAAQVISRSNSSDNSTLSLTQFVSPMVINCVVNGLKPLTKMFVFFDNIPMSNLCTPCNNSITTSFNPTGSEGSNLISSSSGTLVFQIRIPRSTIRAKDCLVRVLDVPTTASAPYGDLTQISSTTTEATCTFFGSGTRGQEVISSISGQVSTATDLSFTVVDQYSTTNESTLSSIQSGTDPYYYKLSKVNNIKYNSSAIYIGGFEIDEQ